MISQRVPNPWKGSDHKVNAGKGPITPHKIHTKAGTVELPAQREDLWCLDEETYSVCGMHDGWSLHQHSERHLNERNNSE